MYLLLYLQIQPFLESIFLTLQNSFTVILYWKLKKKQKGGERNPRHLYSPEMADKLGLGTDVKELRLGSSFTNPRGSAFHTFRCKFYINI